MTVETKTCTKCGETKALEEFPRDRKARLGLHPHCKACNIRRSAEWLVANAEKANARKRSARYLRRQRALYAADPEKHRARARAARAADPEKKRSQVRASAAKSQEMTAVKATNRGKEWTGPELEVAADLRRTSTEVALALGRTKRAVEHIRSKIRTDPRKARMAGTDVEVAA